MPKRVRTMLQPASNVLKEKERLGSQLLQRRWTPLENDRMHVNDKFVRCEAYLKPRQAMVLIGNTPDDPVEFDMQGRVLRISRKEEFVTRLTQIGNNVFMLEKC